MVVAVLKAIKELFADPKDFLNDPYGYVTNQLGHTFLGLFLTTAYIYFVAHFTGVYPSQTKGVIVVALSYLLWWEVLYQKWKGLDSLEDTAFVFAGASLLLVVNVQYAIEELFLWLLFVALLICVGALIRIKRKCGWLKKSKIE